MSERHHTRLDHVACLWMAPHNERLDGLEYMSKVLSRAEELLEAVVAAGVCPECGDGCGYTVEDYSDEGGPIEQHRCQWCEVTAWLLRQPKEPTMEPPCE